MPAGVLGFGLQDHQDLDIGVFPPRYIHQLRKECIERYWVLSISSSQPFSHASTGSSSKPFSSSFFRGEIHQFLAPSLARLSPILSHAHPVLILLPFFSTSRALLQNPLSLLLGALSKGEKRLRSSEFEG